MASEELSFTVRFSIPALFRWNLALSGSYFRCGRFGLYMGSAFAMGWSLPSEPPPFRTFATISSRSTDNFNAIRTSGLSKGATLMCIGQVRCRFPETLSTSMPFVRLSSGKVLALGLLMTSTSPVINAFWRAAVSRMGVTKAESNQPDPRPANGWDCAPTQCAGPAPSPS